MRKSCISESALFNPRVLLALALCTVGAFLAMLGFAAAPPNGMMVLEGKSPADSVVNRNSGLSKGNATAVEASMPLAPVSGPGWSIITSPNVTGSNYLNDVTCASASECWAVGNYNSTGRDQTLIEKWDGTSWTAFSSPNSSVTEDNSLQAVTCTSTSQCWAVGTRLFGTLIERWDGSTWSIVTSPKNPPGFNYLNAVTCTSASDCWAVGYYFNENDVTQTLIEHWNGFAWSIVTSPNASAGYNSLVSVSCTAPSDCWAVGSYQGGGTYQTLIERWNGSSWTIITSPNTGSSSTLAGVTCPSTSVCWAVGHYQLGADQFYQQTLIEYWDGDAWAIVDSPNTSAMQRNSLNDVTCTSASNCWAVGQYLGDRVYTLLEHWDGSSWAIVASPSVFEDDFLLAVTCASELQCWVVGNYYPGSGQQTLIEEYALTIPPLTGVVSRMTHGGAGTYDIDLPLIGASGIECRTSASLGAGTYMMIFTFTNTLTSVGNASVTDGSGTVSTSTLGPNANQYTVNLVGVTNQQYVTVTLANVLDSQNNSGSVFGIMGVLLGDVTANGMVSKTDVPSVKAHRAQRVTSANFRKDVNANGIINKIDRKRIKAQVGISLPTSP